MKKLIMAALFMVILSGLSALTLTGPAWTPTNAYTNSTLNCSWSFDLPDTLSQNVIIRNNSQIYTTLNESNPTTTYLTVPASATTKSEIWTCTVILNNATGSIQNEVNITILNSAPSTEGTPAGIFSNSIDIGYLFNVTEDTTYAIDVNATDGDGDTLTYLPASGFCSIVSSALGTYTCTPTYSYISADATTPYNVTFSATDDQNVGGRTVTFNITPVNDAPTFTITSKSMYENQTLNFTTSVSDEESDFPITINVYEETGTLACITSGIVTSSSFYIACDPDPTETGNFTIAVNITDHPDWTSVNKTTSTAFNLEIISVNHDPTITGISSTTGIQNQSEQYVVIINATDIDNNTLTFSIDAPGCPYSGLWSIDSASSYNGTGTTGNGTINVSLNNSFVVCRDVTIIVSDGFAGTDEGSYTLNITNTNDDPVLYNLSNHSSNTYHSINWNVSNITAYANAPFLFVMNFTDIDNLTYEGEVFTFSDNTSLFNITNAGIINFTPQDGDASDIPSTVLITLRDDSLASSNVTFILTIRNNSPPSFINLSDWQNQICYEYDDTNYPFTCLLNVSLYAEDADIDDAVVNFTTNDSLLTINASTGIINVTVLQSQLGRYGVLITVYDSWGASASTVVNFTINNTNNPPVLDSITLPRLVEGHITTQGITAADDDLNISLDSLTYSLSQALTFMNISQQSNTTALLTFTPIDGDAGNYTVNVTVTDSHGNTSYQELSVNIVNRTSPPTISNITPYGTPASNETVYAWITPTTLGANETSINLSENLTIVLNHTTTDDTTPANELVYTWFVDGARITDGSSTVLSESNHTLTLNLGFQSAGIKNYTLEVNDTFYESSRFSWIANITNINRPPELVSDLENKTVDGTTTYADYLSSANISPQLGFFDPDDDVNENDYLDAETNHLTFTSTSCSIATITFSGTDMTLTPNETGACNVTFNATDSSEEGVQSNQVQFNVTAVTNTTVETETVTSGGGGTSTKTISVPIPEEVEKPIPLRIIVPRLVVIFKNQTMKIPVELHSTWNETLQNINLSVEVNVSNVTAVFDDTFFASLAKNEVKTTTLTLGNYRTNGTYELNIVASVEKPTYVDRATIYINSLEKSSSGEEVDTKVTFARDLLGNNPECQELNELLRRAQTEIEAGNTEQGLQMIDAVINGCKYLVNKVRIREEKPNVLRATAQSVIGWLQEHTDVLAYGGGILAVVGGLVIILRSLRKPT